MLPIGTGTETNPPVEYQENKNEYVLKPTTLPDTSQNNNQNNNQNNSQNIQDVSGLYTADQQKLRYDARYLFEQKDLPKFVFSNESDFIKCFQSSDLETVKKEIQIEWKLAVATVLISTLSPDVQAYALQGVDQLNEVLDPLVAEYGLGNEHLVSVTFESIDNNRSCILIEMLEMDETLLCTYIAIVYSEGGGLKYYTVERTFGLGSTERQYMLCFVDQSGRGSFGLVESNKESVLKAIRDL